MQWKQAPLLTRSCFGVGEKSGDPIERRPEEQIEEADKKRHDKRCKESWCAIFGHNFSSDFRRGRGFCREVPVCPDSHYSGDISYDQSCDHLTFTFETEMADQPGDGHKTHKAKPQCVTDEAVGRFLVECHDSINLRENFLYHVAVDIGQAEITPGIAIGQSLVIESQQVKQGGVEIVHVDFVLDRFVPKLIGGTVGETGLQAIASQPGRKSSCIVIASGAIILSVGRATEFTAEPDDGILQQSPLLQVL